MNNNYPNKNEVIPNANVPGVYFLKNLVDDPRIKIDDFTYFDQVTTIEELMFCIQHFYSFFTDSLITGKFC